MKPRHVLIDFILREWILAAAAVGLVLTSLYTGHVPSWSLREAEVLLILFTLFVAVNGLQRSGIIAAFSRRLEQGRGIPLKLVAATFFLSMLVTNDVALLVVVPLTLALDCKRRDILVILEALAANAGSALTPFGNPQNLFIYWYYDLDPAAFVASIAPFSLVFLAVLALASLAIGGTRRQRPPRAPAGIGNIAWLHGGLLLLVLLAVLRVLPVAAAALVIVAALLFDRKSLRVDYALLFSFLFFFGLAENMQEILAASLQHPGHVFLLSALSSQVMSNVPAALLFSRFTDNWEALLWGVNTGGFGSLFGSLANLIAYKLYVSHDDTVNAAAFTARFLAAGYLAFFLATGLYFLVRVL